MANLFHYAHCSFTQSQLPKHTAAVQARVEGLSLGAAAVLELALRAPTLCLLLVLVGCCLDTSQLSIL